MGSVVLNGATSGSTTLIPTDAVTVNITMPSTSGTLALAGGTNSSISNGTSNVTVNSSGGTVTVATAGTTALTVDTSQNVGIGTTPSYKLDVNGQARISTGLTMSAATSSLYSTDGTLSYYASGNGVYLNGTNSGWLSLQASGTQATYIQLNGASYSTPNIIQFNTNSSERFRIGASGQWGLSGANYGTSGQVLTSQGSGAAPIWASAGGGGTGSIIQTVVSNYTGSQAITSSGSFVSTGHSGSITPQFSTSRILIMVTSVGGFQGSSGGAAYYTIYRNNTTNVSTGASPSILSETLIDSVTGSQRGFTSLAMIIVDSPATTSSTTYTVYFSGTSAYYASTGGAPSSGTSTMTLMEIK